MAVSSQQLLLQKRLHPEMPLSPHLLVSPCFFFFLRKKMAELNYCLLGQTRYNNFQISLTAHLSFALLVLHKQKPTKKHVIQEKWPSTWLTFFREKIFKNYLYKIINYSMQLFIFKISKSHLLYGDSFFPHKFTISL